MPELTIQNEVLESLLTRISSILAIVGWILVALGKPKLELWEAGILYNTKLVILGICSIYIALLFVVPIREPYQIVILVVFGVLFIVSWLLGGWLKNHLPVKTVRALKGRPVEIVKTRGFTLTSGAQSLYDEGTTVEDILKGVSYNLDKVWTSRSRNTAKLLYSSLYCLTRISVICALCTAGFLFPDS